MDVQESLTCPICFGQYDLDKHAPRILPCGNGHSICSVCIGHLLSTCVYTLRCPFDRITIGLKNKSLSDFPQNLALKCFIQDHDPLTFCPLHGDKKLDIVCLECRCRICYICERRNHKGHETELVEDIMVKVHEKAAKFEGVINSIEEIQKKKKVLVEKKELKLLEEVDLKFEEYITQLLDKRDSMKDFIRSKLKKLKEEAWVEESLDHNNIVEWKKEIKQRFIGQNMINSDEKTSEKVLYDLINEEFILSGLDIKTWIEEKQEQVELLLCTLDDIGDDCHEMLMNCGKEVQVAFP